MQCEKFEAQLNEVLDRRGRPDLDPDLASHAGDCARCRELLTGCDALLDGLECRELPEVPGDLPQRVLAGLSPGAVRIGTVAKIAVPAAVIAAAALAAVAWFSSPDPAGESSPPGTQVAEAPVPHPPEAPYAVDVDELPTSPYLMLARLAGQAMATFPSTVRRTVLYGNDKRGGREQPWVSPVAKGIRPLTHSLSGALDALRHTLPGRPNDPDL